MIDPRGDGLKRLWLFSQLGAADLDQIRALARPRRCAARDAVISQGDVSGDLYAVTTGRLKATTSAPDGSELVLSILGPGDVFGEIALLDGAPRSATVTALEPCELVVIEREAFRDLLLRVPGLSLSLMRVLAKRLRDLTEHAQDVSLLTVRARLAKAVLALAGRFGRRPPSGELRVTLRLSQQELGEMLGATREMINRCLRSWVEMGMIEIDGPALIIRDEHALRAAAAGADADR